MGAVGGTSVWTAAALGEKVPPAPPDSFHATMPAVAVDGLIQMPRSWLKPVFAVHRSALPVTMAMVLAVGVTLKLRLVPSTSCHVTPSLLGSEYCWRLGAVLRAGGVAVHVGGNEWELTPAPVPSEFLAATVNQYLVPSVRPGNCAG